MDFDMLTTTEAAKELNLSPALVRRDADRIGCVRVNARMILFPRAAVDAEKARRAKGEGPVKGWPKGKARKPRTPKK